ncbi:peroxiredoxin family protein [Sphingobacterium yanglingense]|uniref:Peroxiredoxin n=1 Tax=Sphingobacterium yanglingense TaxID=1437280 RepID=A0A4R6WNV9_9SPHI|nr:TlpA disulfide reductase family protein [Sphingobacterium yanglingense]TDQ77905.1 peroxiredoxin [Sphingobacterium yanglingense]
MKKITKILVGACVAVLTHSHVVAQNANFVKIDSTSTSFKDPKAIAERKAKALEGLTKLVDATPEFKKAMNEAAADRDFKVETDLYYTAEFIEIPFEQYRKIVFDPSGEWTTDSYGNIAYTKKIAVLRRSTPEEQQERIQSLKGYFTPKTGTPMSDNNKAIESKLVGKLAPDFTVTTLDGKKLTMSSLKGKVVVLNFWFTSCRPCVEEMPDLNKIVAKYADNKDVVFLAPEIIANTTKQDVEKFLKRQPFNYQIGLGGKEASLLYEAKTAPANFVIDKEGVIRMGWVGLNPYELQEMGKMIPELLKK